VSRPWIAAGVAPHVPSCDGCGAPNAPFGIGPPLRKRLGHYCGACNQLQPETQRRIAERARDAIGSDE